MVYKLINEWFGIEELQEHEITVYKYNLNHDEMIRYFVSDGGAVKKSTYAMNSDPIRTELYENGKMVVA